jgi:hypothetical protein
MADQGGRSAAAYRGSAELQQIVEKWLNFIRG